MKTQPSSKRIQINKANSQTVIIVAVAAFISTFALVASQALWSQRSYQAKVIGEKEKAVQQLEANKEAVNSLAVAYKEFVSRSENVIGGDPNGKGESDGDNAKIILDALPSKYDFPALTSSTEKLVEQNNLKIETITGTDDEVAQKDAGANSVDPIEMPYEFTVSGSYESMKKLLVSLEKSIRPFQITKIKFSDTDAENNMVVSLKTYYLPAKTLNITKKVVD